MKATYHPLRIPALLTLIVLVSTLGFSLEVAARGSRSTHSKNVEEDATPAKKGRGHHVKKRARSQEEPQKEVALVEIIETTAEESDAYFSDEIDTVFVASDTTAVSSDLAMYSIETTVAKEAFAAPEAEPEVERIVVAPVMITPPVVYPEGYREAVVADMQVYGLDPAWSEGTEFEKAFDGDTGSYYDYAYGENESFVGYIFDSAQVPVAIHYTPRAGYEGRMKGGRFEGSNDSSVSGFETIYEITATPDRNGETIAIESQQAYRYIRFLAVAGAYGNIAEFSIDLDQGDAVIEVSEPTTESEPTAETEPTTEPEAVEAEPSLEYRESTVMGQVVYGLDPAWASGSEFPRAFDGDPNTYYDYKYGDRETFVGFDYGDSVVPTAIRFQARLDYEGRMKGGVFQASNESSTTGFVTLYEVTEVPTSGEQVIALENSSTYRFYRYLAPSGSYGNIAEFSIDSAVSVSVTDETEAADTGTEPNGNDVEIDPATSNVSSGVRLSLQLDKAGQTSAGVYDSTGRLVRTLLQGELLSAGTQELVWDGLDRNGVPAEAGQTYTLKVLQAEGAQAEFLTILGQNPGSSPYDSWLGTDGGVTAAASDSTGMYLVAQNSETAPTLLKQSHDGTIRHWTESHQYITNGTWQGGIALSSDQNGKLYMLQQNGHLQVLEASSGKLIESWDVLPAGLERVNFVYHHQLGEIAKADVSAYGDTVVMSYYDENSVIWLNPANGSITAQVDVANPLGVAVSPSGAVYVLSGSQVVQVQSDGSVTSVVSTGLNQPERIAFDRSNNTLLVTDGSIGAQVKRFALNGTPLATYGEAGGRAFGKYVNTNFRAITDITVDGFGGFIVAEPRTPPRRVAYFNQQGAVMNEWFGGQEYYAYAEPDPKDPTRAWLFTGDGLVLVSIDLNTGAWGVLETWAPQELANGLVSDVQGWAGRWQARYKGDQLYIMSEGHPQVLRYNDGELRAVSVSSSSSEKLAMAIEISGYHPSWARAFTWVDQNGDGLPQANEINLTGDLNIPNAMHINSDFSLIGHTRGNAALEVNKTEALWGPFGPYYPIFNDGGLVSVASTETPRGAESRGTGSYEDEEGSFYSFYNLAKENHGVFWPTYWSSISRFVKFDSEGNEMWAVGRHAYQGGLAGSHDTTYIPTPHGQFHVLARVIGDLDDAIVLADRVENPGMIWTKDGLYAGTLFDRRADDGLPDSVYSWHLTESGEDAITTSDNGSGGKIIQYDDGTVLWFTQGRNSVPVYKITGFDDWTRQETQFVLTEAPVVAVAEGSGLVARYYDDELTGTPVLSRVETQVWHGLAEGVSGNDQVVDGKSGSVYDWTNGSDVMNRQSNYSIRWVGEVEAPLTEAFTFSVYARGAARLWVNGQQVIRSWNEVTPRVESIPIVLEAGKRYSIQLDYTTTQDQPAVSLNWESQSIDRERIPSHYLYPVETTTVFEPQRSAIDYIEAASFDNQSGHMEDWLTDEFGVYGQRQWGFGATGSYMGYTNIDFDSGVSKLIVQAGGIPSREDATYPVRIAFRLDSPDGPTIAEMTLPHAVQAVEFPVASIQGHHDVYVVNLTINEWHYMDFNWFKFE